MSVWHQSPYFHDDLAHSRRLQEGGAFPAYPFREEAIPWNYLLGKVIEWYDSADKPESIPWKGRVQAINSTFVVVLNFEGLIYVPWARITQLICREPTEETEESDDESG